MDPAPLDEVPTAPEPSPPTWSLLDALAAYLVGLGGSIAASIVWLTFGDEQNETGMLAVASIGLWIGFIGGPLLASRKRGSGSLATDFGLEAPSPKQAVLAVGLGVGVQLAVIPIVYWLLAPVLDAQGLGDPARELNRSAASTGAFLLLSVVVIIGAPIAEELFFRGLLQRSLLRRMGPVPAVLISATAFGLSHFQVVQLPALVALGLVLGALAHRTRSLGPPILAHAAFNAVTMAFLAASR